MSADIASNSAYVIAGITATVGTVRWLLQRQKKHEDEERAKQRAYVDGQVEIIKRGYQEQIKTTCNEIKETNGNINHLIEKLDLILVDMRDDISELHSQVFGSTLPKSYKERRHGGIINRDNNPIKADRIDTNDFGKNR